MAKKKNKKQREIERKKRELKQAMISSERFNMFLRKLEERLRIITEYNIAAGVDPSDEDITLLEILAEVYDEGELSWIMYEPENTENVSQSEMFQDNMAV